MNSFFLFRCSQLWERERMRKKYQVLNRFCYLIDHLNSLLIDSIHTTPQFESRIFLKKSEENEWCNKQPKSKLKSQTYTRCLLLLCEQRAFYFCSFQFLILPFSIWSYIFSSPLPRKYNNNRTKTHTFNVQSQCIHSMFFSLLFTNFKWKPAILLLCIHNQQIDVSYSMCSEFVLNLSTAQHTAFNVFT